MDEDTRFYGEFTAFQIDSVFTCSLGPMEKGEIGVLRNPEKKRP